MDEQVVAHLERIEKLLQRRVEQADQARVLQDARLAVVHQKQADHLSERISTRKNVVDLRKDALTLVNEIRQQRMEELKEELTQKDAAQEEFQAAVLAELRRHGDLLEKLLREERL